MPDYKKVWLICNQCGYNIEVSEKEIWDYCECSLCGGKMVLDLNKGKKIKEDWPGDNFPKINNQSPITQEEVEDFRIDLETLSIKEIFKRLGV